MCNTMLFWIILVFMTTGRINANCNTKDEVGQWKCSSFHPQYSGYQWATCLSDRQIKNESFGKYRCLNNETHCFYQCMVEMHDETHGTVYTDCSCSSIYDIPPYQNITLLPSCYMPQGHCNWYSRCFDLKYNNSEYFQNGMLTFHKSVCNIHEKHEFSFSQETLKWLTSVKLCLQIKMVRSLRPYVQYKFSDIRALSLEVNRQCFANPEWQQPELSVCSISNTDFYRIVVTLNEEKSNETSGGVGTLLKLRSECSKKETMLNISSVTVIRIQTKFHLSQIYPVSNQLVPTKSDIVDELSISMQWKDCGISWYFWSEQNQTHSSNLTRAINILLASRFVYDMSYNISNTNVNLDSIVETLASGIIEGMSIEVFNQTIGILSLEACGDLLCQHIYRSTMPNQTNDDYCIDEMYDGIKWWTTAAGQTDVQKCPDGYTGNSTRYCSLNGEWNPPGYIHCVDQKLQESTEQLEELETISDPKEVSVIISGILDLVENTTSSGDHRQKPLKSGDLKRTTDILSSVIRIGGSKNATINSEQVASVLDSILNTENQENWAEVNNQGDSDDGAAKIMRIVDDLGSVMQKMLSANETKTISRRNFEIEISTLRKNLQFPQDSNSKLQLPDQHILAGKFYTAAMYKTISGILPTSNNRSVGSDVLSVSFGKIISNLQENITLVFERNKKVPFKDPNVSCGYWNFTAKRWSYNGCFLRHIDSSTSTCSCNHLTNFAILMSPNDVEISATDQKILEIITFVGCGLSILGCFLTLVIYFVFWRFVKNEWAVILMNLCIILIVGYSVFLSATEETDNELACNIITAVLHYAFLVVFFLMLAEGICVTTSVTVVFKQKSKLPIYLTLAWVIPLVIVGATLGITRADGYHSDRYCWLNIDNFVFMAFVGPALLIILVNIGTIVLVLRALYSSTLMVNERIQKKARAGLKCMVTLLPVLGLSWVFGVLAFNEDTILFQYLFGITTSIQGLLIFIFHTVFNKKIHEGFRKTMNKRKNRALSNFTSKPRSSGTLDRLDSRVSSTDTTKLRDLKPDVKKNKDMFHFLKKNRYREYQVTKE